jgi:hypothetical protein
MKPTSPCFSSQTIPSSTSPPVRKTASASDSIAFARSASAFSEASGTSVTEPAPALSIGRFSQLKNLLSSPLAVPT